MFIHMSFPTRKELRKCIYALKKPILVKGINLPALQFKVHEQDATPILQMSSIMNIPTAGWVSFRNKNKRDDSNKLTYCHEEYDVSYKCIRPIQNDKTVEPLVLSFDIEVNSSNPSRMPKADNPRDKNIPNIV